MMRTFRKYSKISNFNLQTEYFQKKGKISFFQKCVFWGVWPRKLSLSKIGVMDMSYIMDSDLNTQHTIKVNIHALSVKLFFTFWSSKRMQLTLCFGFVTSIHASRQEIKLNRWLGRITFKMVFEMNVCSQKWLFLTEFPKILNFFCKIHF